MKKMISLLISAMLCITLAACGAGGNVADSGSSDSGAENAQEKGSSGIGVEA